MKNERRLTKIILNESELALAVGDYIRKKRPDLANKELIGSFVVKREGWNKAPVFSVEMEYTP